MPGVRVGAPAFPDTNRGPAFHTIRVCAQGAVASGPWKSGGQKSDSACPQGTMVATDSPVPGTWGGKGLGAGLGGWARAARDKGRETEHSRRGHGSESRALHSAGHAHPREGWSSRCAKALCSLAPKES